MAGDRQDQAVGERGIGVQISGNSNSVVVFAGAAELVLARKHARKSAPTTELELLRVDLRATKLVGRDGDVESLRAWLMAERPISFRCITGRAGAGKTRLAIELCEHAEADGWTAGFVQYSQFPGFVERAAGWRWSKPTLVVIDYAAALARDLRVWLEILARHEARPDEKRLRVLLLERHAERELGWWADLIRPVSLSDPGPDELADPPEPVALATLSAIEDRRALLAEAMRLGGTIAGTQPLPRPPPGGVDADFDRRLGDDTINNEPLYLMMAGAEAVRTGAPTALALSRIDLAERVAGREREQLNRLARDWNLPEKLIAHLAMCVTLQGGCSAENALRLVEEERPKMDFAAAAPAADIVNLLAEALPNASGTGIDAVRPDLIGEAFLLQGMQEYRLFSPMQTAIVERAWRRAGGKVAATLVRTAQDYARGEALHPSVVWLRHLIDQTVDWATLLALIGELPKDTLALRELAAFAQDRITSALADQAHSDTGLRPHLAASLNNLANRLSDLGQSEKALATAEQAVALHSELAAQRPDALQPNLARSLNNLAARLSALGQRDKALVVVKEAVALRRGLAAQRPDVCLPDLAMSLNNLAAALSDLGQRDEALAAAEEAVALYRNLAGQRPDAFRPNLAGSLNTLASRLRVVGQPERALAAAEEAVALCRELAVQRPDALRPYLALSLSNLAVMLSTLGQGGKALAVAEEAVTIRRGLAAQRPDAFRPDLAELLNNLATILSALGQRKMALAAAEEAVALRRELAAQRPDAFRPNLAVSLAVKANCLDALGRAADALAANAEGLTTLASAFVQQPAAFGPWMRSMVGQYLTRCKRLGRPPDLKLLGPTLAILQEHDVRTGERLG